MKKTALLMVLMTAALASAAQSACSGFRTGNYRYTNDSLETFFVKRTAKKQEEINSKTRVKTVSRIKWISDCEYELIQVWSNSKKQRRYNRSTTRVKITNAGADSYEFSCDCKTADHIKQQTGTMIRVK